MHREAPARNSLEGQVHSGHGGSTSVAGAKLQHKPASPSLARYQLSVLAHRSPSTGNRGGFPALDTQGDMQVGQSPPHHVQQATRCHSPQNEAQCKASGVASFSDISSLQGDFSTTNSRDTSEGAACMPRMHGKNTGSPQQHLHAYSHGSTKGRGRGSCTGDSKPSRSASTGRGRSRGYIMKQVRAAAQRQQSGDADPSLATGAVHLPVALAQIDRLRIFRTIFWVSLREYGKHWCLP